MARYWNFVLSGASPDMSDHTQQILHDLNEASIDIQLNAKSECYMERISTQKHHQHSSVFKEVKIMTLRNLHKITFILFECHRFIDKLIESFISLCYGEKVHDKKKVQLWKFKTSL